MNGKNKDLLRKQFETQIGKKPLNNKGGKTKGYQDWLKKNCTPHWMTEATELFKFEPQLVAGDLTFAEAKQKAREKTQLAEKCIITPASRIKSRLKEFEEKFSKS